MKKVLFHVFIAVSLFLGSCISFWIYFKEYMMVDSTISQDIKELLESASVIEDKKEVFLFGISFLALLLFWVLAFVLYKIIFKIARVKVSDSELLIAIGSAYTLSFLVGYLLVGNIDNVLLTVITNILEMSIIGFALFDKIKKRLRICAIARVIILLFNIGISSLQ